MLPEAVMVAAGGVGAAMEVAVVAEEGREEVVVSAALPQARRVDESAEEVLVVDSEAGRAKRAQRETAAVVTARTRGLAQVDVKLVRVEQTGLALQERERDMPATEEGEPTVAPAEAAGSAVAAQKAPL